jgi:hypothetical protein
MLKIALKAILLLAIGTVKGAQLVLIKRTVASCIFACTSFFGTPQLGHAAEQTKSVSANQVSFKDKNVPMKNLLGEKSQSVESYRSQTEALLTRVRPTQRGNLKLPEPTNELNKLVTELESMNPTDSPGVAKNFEKYASGSWNVVYAPHIRTLEKVLSTNFDVSYSLDGKGNMESNVKFENKIIRGWLNAQGRYYSKGNDEVSIKWNNLWANIGSEGPSNAEETKEHFLPSLVQSLGKFAFIEPISRFPVSFLSNELCIFEFPAFGSKIVTAKTQ